MEYPQYKNRIRMIDGKIIMSFIIVNIILSCFVPVYVYIGGSFLFILTNVYFLTKYRGLKAFGVFITSIMMLLLAFDFVDKELTWSLDFVFPSFLITMAVLQLLIVSIRRKNWIKNYDVHIYVLLLNIAMVILFIFGVIESNVMIIVTYSIFMATVIAIRMIVGKAYRTNVQRFTHF